MPPFSLFPLDCFQVVGQSPCPELVCTRGHVLARTGGPSDQSQASGRARIGLSLQLLMPSDLNAGRVDLMLFSGPNMEGLILCGGFANLSLSQDVSCVLFCTCYILEYSLAYMVLLMTEQYRYGIHTSGSNAAYRKTK